MISFLLNNHRLLSLRTPSRCDWDTKRPDARRGVTKRQRQA
jgi:hypothetical protein